MFVNRGVERQHALGGLLTAKIVEQPVARDLQKPAPGSRGTPDNPHDVSAVRRADCAASSIDASRWTPNARASVPTSRPFYYRK